MPSVTFDGRSFMLDGRRIWLVSGSIHYARVPRALWKDRIHAAKLSGLNTIEVPVFWSRHEPLPGKFDFEGDNDLRHFVELIGEAGLHCILRPGPFIGLDADFGGLPAWLASVPEIVYRSANPQFLEASSRYLAAVAEQVRSLQVTSPGKGGPIILVQNEAQWNCGVDEALRGYLSELSRYLRESGLNVPTINSNNLWHGVEGEIDCWVGQSSLLPTMRQLSRVRPDQPRMVIDLPVMPTPVWGQDATGPSPATIQRKLAEVLAGGGQFNLQPFHAGTNLGVFAGASPLAPGAYGVTGYGREAPLDDFGLPGKSFHHIRRICTFASRFSRLLASLDPDFQPVVFQPADLGARKGSTCSVVHAQGAQGGIAFVFGPDPDTTNQKPGGLSTTLLMSDGSAQEVHLGEQAVSWCVMDYNLSGRARLDYSTLCALGHVGETLVCFGPAGKDGTVSINGSPLTVTAPKGKTPLVIEHEGCTLVVCNERQIDEVYIAEAGVYTGVESVLEDGAVIEGQGAKLIGKDSAPKPVTGVPRQRATGKVSQTPWTAALTNEYLEGTSPRFASIDGPADLATLGAAAGYGWYRIELKVSAAKRPRLLAPQSADRLHFWQDGQPLGLIGSGPGCGEDKLACSFGKGTHTLVVLAENLGRDSFGHHLGDPKGLWGPLWEVKAFKAGKASLETGAPIDPFKFRAPVWGAGKGDFTHPSRVTWSFTHRRKSPLFLHIKPIEGVALLVLNDEPIGIVDRGSRMPLCLWPEQLRAGSNVVQLAAMPGLTPDSLLESCSGATFHEGASDFTAKASWAFAKWEPPARTAFKEVTKTEISQIKTPAWWRCSFKASDSDRPVAIDLSGMTKGQIYINDTHLGRYFVAEPTGKAVPPQSLYYIPEPMLDPELDNEITLFDEHGGNPARVTIGHAKGHAIRASAPLELAAV
jgi:hypothetical protein